MNVNHDFTEFDIALSKIQEEHANELHSPLSKYFTIYLNERYDMVWILYCPTVIRNKVIAAAHETLKYPKHN